MKTEILAQQILDAAASADKRYLVAIAGPPGSGKSTLAGQLCEQINQHHPDHSVIVPMDGFHLDNELLDQRGLRHRKGAPETFDSEGFVRLVETLAVATETIQIPVFDRTQDTVVENADSVDTRQQILLLEGNYLLLDYAPWQRLAKICQMAIFLDPAMEVLEERLIARWLHYGHTPEAARQRALSNDIPNAQHVKAHSDCSRYPAHYHLSA